MKGTFSELELSTLRQRSQEALRLKAARGDLHTTVAIGYRRSADDRLEQDPDRRTREALSLVFRKFREIGSVRQLVLWLRQERIELPTAVHGPQGRTARWRLPSYHAVHRLLTNPVYAGAYVFGRTVSRTRVEGGRKVITHGVTRRSEDWTVLIRDHHDGYISWEEYDRNRKIIAGNANMKGAMVAGRPTSAWKDRRRTVRFVRRGPPPLLNRADFTRPGGRRRGGAIMTALGKILVIINLIFSLVVCGLMVMVYVARTNWAEGYSKQKKQYEIVQKSFEAKKKELEDAQAQWDGVIKDLKEQIAQKDKRIKEEEKNTLDAKQQRVEEHKILDEEAATVTKLKSELERREKEVQKLEEALVKKDDDIKRLAKEVSDERNEKTNAQMQVAILLERLNRMNGQMEELVRENTRLKRTGGTGESIANNPPPQNVKGVITNTDVGGLVTISLGSDAGLATGHTLDVFRLREGGKYLGRIRLIDVKATEAVGRPVQKMMKGTIQVGDQVASDVAKFRG